MPLFCDSSYTDIFTHLIVNVVAVCCTETQELGLTAVLVVRLIPQVQKKRNRF